MHAAHRLLVAVPVGAALAWASVIAFDIARADDLIREAATEMSTWAATQSRPDPATWDSVHANLKAAESIHALNPRHHELLGIMGSLRTESPEQIPVGIGHLVKALELRPAAPYTWALLAEARYNHGEPGRNLELPLERASRLGPFEPGVQRQVADYGLAVWGEISPSSQAAVERMVASGSRRNPLEMLQISERRGRLDTACRHLTDSSRAVGPQRGTLCPWEITP